ncbi:MULTISPECIES: HpcH/HpaI aldolase/citrate lyase family protein [Streptomyces]|uniref:HpcH/HpaI aldolase/citrate lyase family protein n=1 Tax=Streptomyces TaxID=1883 RepID=UPI0015FDB609|nr:CoA ester lyase [Streptomyces sp. GMR22]MBA6436937.1 CoA ester lyase [Streptomyces sp. GMR22]
MEFSERTMLFVPGDRPDRFSKAASSGADAVLIDLEDAVPADNKAAARAAAIRWLVRHRSVVRINAPGSPWHAEDLAALAEAPALRGVVLPKCSTAEQVASVIDHLPYGVSLLPLIESAIGLREAGAIAGLPRVGRLLFGSVDYALDTGITPSPPEEPELLWARSSLVNASQAAGLPSPLDGVHTRLDDEEGLATSSRRSRALGFGGRLCVHPLQVATVHRAWQPTDQEIQWARGVIQASSASNGGATRVDGQMVDRPVLQRARRLLSLADKP